MENIPKLKYKVNKDKTIECEYYFAYVNTNRDSSNIDLVIHLNDPDRNVKNFITSVNKNFLNKNAEEIESFAKSELDPFYHL